MSANSVAIGAIAQKNLTTAGILMNALFGEAGWERSWNFASLKKKSEAYRLTGLTEWTKLKSVQSDVRTLEVYKVKTVSHIRLARNLILEAKTLPTESSAWSGLPETTQAIHH